jgi:hypothetical protein
VSFLVVTLTCVQILSVTCDNASNNDTMIEELKDLVAAFAGEASRTRCFAHIINLIAKSVIKQFDVPKAKAGEVMDDAIKELTALAGDIETEERVTRDTANEDDEVEDDNVEDWVDELMTMSKDEKQELDNDIQPVRRVLVKVSVKHVSLLTMHSTAMGRVSSARLRTLSRTHQRSSYLDGM